MENITVETAELYTYALVSGLAFGFLLSLIKKVFAYAYG
jgi:hypothetical protein